MSDSSRDQSDRPRFAGELRFFGTMTASISHEINNVLAMVNELSGLFADSLMLAQKKGRPLDPERLAGIVDRATRIERTERYDDAGKMGYDLEYFMYHKGYGPTIVTMEGYLREVFPDRPWGEPIVLNDDELSETEVIVPPPVPPDGGTTQEP